MTLLKRTQSHILKSILILFTLGLGLVSTLQAEPIPLEIKKIVTFIYYQSSPTNTSPDGTGFLVDVPSIKDTNKFFGYLVTAKHVVRPATNFWLPNLIIRLNRRDGSSDMVPVPIIASGPKQNIFIHDDPTVDIVVIPFFPNPEKYDFLFLPQDFITTELDFKRLDIHEGSDVFFTGMFIHQLGNKHNTPITRFGRVALINEGKVDWVFGKTDMYLIEGNSYPGNSGSPVFFQIGIKRGGSLVIGRSGYKLAGIMSGCYNDLQPIQTVSVSTNQFVTPNLGIAGVVPSYELKEILYSKELKQERGD